MPGELIPEDEFFEEVRPKNWSGYKDIGVSMRREVLEHKKNDGVWDDGEYCYWTLRNLPENVGEGSRLWVASEGKWCGFFTVFEVDQSARDEESDEFASEIRFWSESWEEVDGGPRKPFRGFTYKVPVPPKVI